MAIPRGPIPPHQRYTFELDGEVVLWVVLSLEFVKSFPLPEPVSSPLLNDYPVWTKSLRMVCIKGIHLTDPTLPEE